MSQILPLLVDGAKPLGISLNDAQLAQFQLYYETLVDWNSRMNLTAITGYDDVQSRHFLDSLLVGSALLEEMRVGGATRLVAPPHGLWLVDIGTGAGFPGLPLKILWPQLQVTLVDSTGKKTTFLQEVVRLLNLQKVGVLTARAEDMGQEKVYRQHFDVATARAVSSLSVLCEYLLPLLRVGGLMLAPKKGDIRQELRDARKAAAVLGGDEPRLHSFILPGSEEERYVVSVRKIKPTPPAYPRRVGLAKARPIGSE
ncbi:MAG: 16S rRNA (guanine(527)-N(7))-methyltransferase RsmG [Chloroflexota bacterium]|nr:16S rRNA (guanine(527)-N(7))-methyltransferase RsmG [Chloroflexota bacterium]